MILQIHTTYPLWWAIICLLGAAGLAWLLYTRNPFGDDEVKRRSPLYITLIALRFLSLFLIAFLLLAPFLKSTTKKVQKPVIVIAQDNSQSIRANKDSAFYTTEYPKKIEALANQLSKDFDVKIYGLDGKVNEDTKFDFEGKQTNLGNLFTEIANRYENQNLGAVIVASDGLYNIGANPVYAAENNKVPVFTIALGDTTVPRDLLVKNIRNNKIAYLGNTFPVEILVAASKLQGSKTTLTVTKNGKTLYSKQLDITGENYLQTENLQLPADESGTQHYTVQLTTISGEVSYINNRKDFFIEVLDGRNKILLLAQAPHPDLAAIKQAVESNQNYEVVITFAKGFTNYAELKKYNLVILHQLPTIENPVQNLLAAIENNKLPLLSIVGMQTNISDFNDVGTGITINNFRNQANDVLPLYNDAFSLFTFSDEAKAQLRFFPPVKSPFGNYGNVPAANTALYQQIGAVKTQQPLLYFSQNTERRTGVLLGEGFWRWRLHNFERAKNHDATNELMTKTIQFLAAKNDTRKFRVSAQKNTFYENENVLFDAQVYNESYEAITEPDVKMEIKNADGKAFTYTFNKANTAYTLNAGYFAAGSYTYKATVKVGNRDETLAGKFTIVPLQVELLETVANHQLMRALATKNGGVMVYPNEVEKLTQLIKAREDINPVSYMQTAFKDIINLKWVFFVLLMLLAAEWFLRRRNGSY
jgi:lipopolysaccharide export system protein LptC